MAKAAKRGIWRGDVVAPWEWRKGKRLAGTQKSGHTAASRQGRGRCTIKRNIGKSGTRIYHVPGGRFYDRTRTNALKGERWFCTEAEARAAGWRRSRQQAISRCPHPIAQTRSIRTPRNAAYNTRARGLQRACLGATAVPRAMA